MFRDSMITSRDALVTVHADAPSTAARHPPVEGVSSAWPSGWLRHNIKEEVMSTKQIAAAMALALVVFGWSVVMAAMGHASLIAAAAPVLGLTITQVLRSVRSRALPAVGRRVEAVPDKDGGAP
ncbi:hypothetical protein ACFQ9J_25265 [Streptomyces sp. NPDC056529]|uniref:hypothetical protein n=1 Tax=Streptomyces sp. NPDC056529 TaxID=3345855 RepID=UPI00369A1070